MWPAPQSKHCICCIYCYIRYGGLAILSTPLWRPSTCKLAAFAATPLGMGVLAFVAAALTYLAIYAISKNNEISELKALKVIKDGLLVTKDAFREIARNNQVKDEEGKVEKDKHYIDFSLEGKNYRIIVDIDQLTKTLGNTLLFKIDSLKEKNDEGKFEAVNETKWSKTLGLDKDGAKEVNTYLGQLISVEQVASQQQTV
ncbi:hypothetical protein [Wolbachia endosymbiont (group A) of Lasioglossum morio]|uniref:hypothetical protein n=1 Tax=Wolbachia endosymbiont (group A) of Lasioglossum morio TaxID=2954025 RepID=UPI0022260613|nr:hypothetical protein [Wolbachia endosymbiont (group A) of Lasioglossum morio]